MTVFSTQDFQVPIIAVFTKYDQFLFNVEMDVSDDPDKYLNRSVSEVAEELFQEHYVYPLGDNASYVWLESKSQAIREGDMLMFFERNAHEW